MRGRTGADGANEPAPGTTYRPLGARVVAVAAAGCLLAVFAVLALALPAPARAGFTAVQTATLVLFLVAVLAVLYGVARTRVHIDDTGITVLNGYRRHRLEWAEAIAISLPRGAPWAVIDAADGTVVSVMALQSADGERARRAVRALAAGLDAHSGPDPDW